MARYLKALEGGHPSFEVSDENLKQARRVLVKNARAHIFFETGEPHYDDPYEVWFGPASAWSKRDVANFQSGKGLAQVWCEMGSRWNTRVIEGDEFDEFGFLIVQPDVYRFRIEEGGRGVSMILRNRFLARIFWKV